MFGQELARLEGEFYRGLNRMVEPFIRAGVASPGLWPTGAIVLEVTARKSGQKINVPLLATRVGNLVVVSTLRRRSQWVKNLAANSEIRYWMGGRLHEATAFVFAPGLKEPLIDDLPPLASCLANALMLQSSLFGVGFAILAPRQAN